MRACRALDPDAEKCYNYSMKLKKPMTVKKPGPASAPAAAPGGATIADRFKLEPAVAPKSAGGGTVSKVAALVALVAAIAALVVSGALVFTLHQHWEFLKLA